MKVLWSCAWLLVCANSTFAASPCQKALELGEVCFAANERALELITTSHLQAVIVVQDVQSGAVVAWAASHPSELDVITAIRPLSLSKLLLCASWWDNKQPEAHFSDAPNRDEASIHELLVLGHDVPGKQMAIALRKAVGANAIMEDFKRYGFVSSTGLAREENFWAELAPAWRTLQPAAASVTLSSTTPDEEWAETLSIGEINMSVTALHISRFLQAVGNSGVMLMPRARQESVSPLAAQQGKRVMQEATSHKLEAGMRDTVKRGTAKSIATVLEGTGWQIGGKTGSGPALLPKGPQLDGWFAGLIFDPAGKARFTVATFVRSGGFGGGNAARISAELARYLIGSKEASGPER